MNKNKNRMVILILVVVSFIGCKKLVEVDGPNTSLNSANVYEEDITAISVLNGVYTNLSSAYINTGSLTSMSFLAGLSSDEFLVYNAASSSPYINAYSANALGVQVGGYEFWSQAYQGLYVINAAIEGLSNSTTLTPVVKQQLLGEAKFMRAFSFFYLVNLYGDVPLILSTNYVTNASMPRTPKAKVWQQIIEDLKEAKDLLSPGYLGSNLLSLTTERVRPTKWAATALLARAYLYTGNWQDAEIQATAVLQNNLFDLVSLDQVFKKNNKEAIWQLQPVMKIINTADAVTFIPTSGTDYDKPVLSSWLLNSFEPGDQRKDNWVGIANFNGTTCFFPYKYKIPSNDLNTPYQEYSTVLRLAEQYLIRAEARIMQNKIVDGIADLNVLRDRATDKTPGAIQLTQLPNTLSREDALKAVMHERQIELFSEWGHRWLDLKRTGMIDDVMKTVVPGKVAGGVWKSYQQWYPLPLSDLQQDSKLVQNQGY